MLSCHWFLVALVSFALVALVSFALVALVSFALVALVSFALPTTSHNITAKVIGMSHESSIQITPNIFFMDPDSDPDHSQHLITCSLSHLGHILIISSKSVHNFELSVFKNYILWIQIQIVIQITPKIYSFLSFTFSDIS